MMRRSGKWYRKNEKEVMELLGLDPTPNSGSGWIIKEDGQNENIICQLKSTDKQGLRIEKLDLDKLRHNARVAHKIPVFAIQFIQSDDVYLMIKPEDIFAIHDHLLGIIPDVDRLSLNEPIVEVEKNIKPNNRLISGSSVGRDRFYKERERKYNKVKPAK